MDGRPAGRTKESNLDWPTLVLGDEQIDLVSRQVFRGVEFCKSRKKKETQQAEEDDWRLENSEKAQTGGDCRDRVTPGTWVQARTEVSFEWKPG